MLVEEGVRVNVAEGWIVLVKEGVMVNVAEGWIVLVREGVLVAVAVGWIVFVDVGGMVELICFSSESLVSTEWEVVREVEVAMGKAVFVVTIVFSEGKAVGVTLEALVSSMS